MSLSRLWVTRCDHEGCKASIIHETIPFGEKADYGMATNDAGWDARPGREETFCPDHHTPETETP